MNNRNFRLHFTVTPSNQIFQKCPKNFQITTLWYSKAYLVIIIQGFNGLRLRRSTPHFRSVLVIRVQILQNNYCKECASFQRPIGRAEHENSSTNRYRNVFAPQYSGASTGTFIEKHSLNYTHLKESINHRILVML